MNAMAPMVEVRMRRAAAGAVLLLALGLLAGCSGGATVAVEGDFPTPLVAPLPISVGLVLDDALTTFVHDEEIERFGHWRVEVGPMQGKLFRAVVGAMFQGVTEVPDVQRAAGQSGVIVPEIQDFQISIPARTRSDFYEVWIKYVIRLYDEGGTLVVEWPLTAYGKTSREDYGVLQDTDGPGMRDATIIALRDAGAFLALRFPQVPEVQEWIARHAPPVAPTGDST
jgi:hypothetical protein